MNCCPFAIELGGTLSDISTKEAQTRTNYFQVPLYLLN